MADVGLFLKAAAEISGTGTRSDAFVISARPLFCRWV